MTKAELDDFHDAFGARGERGVARTLTGRSKRPLPICAGGRRHSSRAYPWVKGGSRVGQVIGQVGIRRTVSDALIPAEVRLGFAQYTVYAIFLQRHGTSSIRTNLDNGGSRWMRLNEPPSRPIRSALLEETRSVTRPSLFIRESRSKCATRTCASFVCSTRANRTACSTPLIPGVPQFCSSGAIKPVGIDGTTNSSQLLIGCTMSTSRRYATKELSNGKEIP